MDARGLVRHGMGGNPDGVRQGHRPLKITGMKGGPCLDQCVFAREGLTVTLVQGAPKRLQLSGVAAVGLRIVGNWTPFRQVV
jgi:hypothetical protein